MHISRIWSVGRTIRRREASSRFVGAPGNRSDSDNGAYTAAVEQALADPAAFARFKRDPRYTRVLEHATEEAGSRHLAALRERAPDLVERVEAFRANDHVGGPQRFSYDGVGAISPSTLVYMRTAATLRELFGDLSAFTIAEIGVGYGGLMLVIDRLWRCRRYDMFDLPPVLELASRCLEAHVLNGAYRPMTLNRATGEDAYDLVISEWAYSELPAHLERMYADKVLARARRGFLSMNSGRIAGQRRGKGKLMLDELREILPPFEVLEHEPDPAPHRYRIVWGHGPQAPAVSGLHPPD